MIAKTVFNLYHQFPDRVLDPVTGAPVSLDRLVEVLPPSLAAMELDTRAELPVPEDLREVFAEYRPTPIFEARRFAEAIGGGSRILVKDEGRTASGNHKMNSALWIAYHCARDGVRTITTETTGNWGLALALAGQRFGVHVVCFLDKRSADARPDREELMRRAGAEVIVVGGDDDEYDPLVLSANEAVTYTRQRGDSAYIFGSVYNYFILPQTMTGVEARAELGDEQPDVVVGSCGGGANLLGIAAPYLAARVDGTADTEVLCAESELCPIVSKGVLGHYSIDEQDHYPKLVTYGLERLLGSAYIGGLGSTIVAAPVAAFHQAGALRTAQFSADEAARAAQLFERTEGRRVALETGYQLAGVIQEARRRPGGRILVNVSSVDRSSFA
ncbi:pyridoxal-phosphate dependent enzyme [Micromonospora sp. URMC 107]|uniref:pyridoxal-phosphate dependent enzyme n=1 Tax=Micromonospora sp. URMC 107 TaxID=3423418 RepID=UPI003F1CE506